MKKINLLALTTGCLMLTALFTGCGDNTPTASTTAETTTEASTAADTIDTNAGGGVLCLKVNPEIAVTYDADGKVTDLRARNEDGSAILADFGNYLNRDCREVVTDLVEDIGEAGYFVEEVEGEARQIVIEIEDGSMLPSDDFLDDVVADVQYCVSTNNWSSNINVEGESNYGVTNYDDTDYGTNSDGVTDYNSDTDYGVGNDGITDYNDTDYGVGNDGITDYEATTKAPEKTTTKVTVPVSGDSGYDDTDYGANSDGVTDYTDTDYGAGSDGVTDYTPSYNDSGYSNYGDSGYDD